jgi:hypothetical protein
MFRSEPISVCPALASAFRSLRPAFAESLERANAERERPAPALPFHLSLAQQNEAHRRAWRQSKASCSGVPVVGRLIDLHA